MLQILEPCMLRTFGVEPRLNSGFLKKTFVKNFVKKLFFLSSFKQTKTAETQKSEQHVLMGHLPMHDSNKSFTSLSNLYQDFSEFLADASCIFLEHHRSDELVCCCLLIS